MKYYSAILLGTFCFVGSLFAAYMPTATDQALVSGFSAKITTMYQQNPAKIETIAPKLQVIVGMYSDDTREYYVLQGLYLHIMSLLNTVNAVANQVVAPMPVVTQPAPVVTPTPAPVPADGPTQPTGPIVTTPVVANTSTNFANNNGSMVSYVSPGVYADPDVQALYNLIQDSHIKGNPNAQFTAIKFSDYECPTCQRYSLAGTADALIQQYNGQVNYVLTHLKAGDYHALAQKAAEATECVGVQGGSTAYYRFESELFLGEPSRSRIESSFDYINESGTMDKQAFLSCLDAGEYESKVNASRAVGIALGASGTPTHVFFDSSTGQYLVLQGAISLDSWIEIISGLPGGPQ